MPKKQSMQLRMKFQKKYQAKNSANRVVETPSLSRKANILLSIRLPWLSVRGLGDPGC